MILSLHLDYNSPLIKTVVWGSFEVLQIFGLPLCLIWGNQE